MTDDELSTMLSEVSESDIVRTPKISPLVVRIHRLTHQMVMRICKWAKLTLVDVCADVTLDAGSKAVNMLVTELKARALDTRVRIITFTSSDMEELYAALRHPVLEEYRMRHLWMMFTGSHAWAYTAEALTVCGLGHRPPASKEEMMCSDQHQHHHHHQQHVWVFEIDCDVTFPIDEFMCQYADDDADLIAKELVPASSIATEWMWYDCATPLFISQYRLHRRCAHVHAFRASWRLLHKLHTEALRGAIGYGEMSIPTVCIGSGMIWRPLLDQHLGQPYDPHGKIGQEEFDELERRRDCRLYHALKF